MIMIDWTPVALLGLLIFALVRIIAWRRRRPDWRLEGLRWLFFLYGLAVLRVTFFPLPFPFGRSWAHLNLVPLQASLLLLEGPDMAMAVRNLGGNLLLLMPFGFLLPLVRPTVRGWWPVIWRGLACSFAIELVQFLTGTRIADVDDLILNVLGTAVGYALLRLVQHWLGRGRRPGTTAI